MPSPTLSNKAGVSDDLIGLADPLPTPAFKLDAGGGTARSRRHAGGGPAQQAASGEGSLPDESPGSRKAAFSTRRVPLSAQPPSSRAFRFGDLFVMLIVLVGAFVGTNLEQAPARLDDFLAMRMTVQNVLLLGVFVLFWNRLFVMFGLYDDTRVRSRKGELAQVATASTLGATVTLFFSLISSTGAFAPETTLLFWSAVIPATLMVREAIRWSRVVHSGRQPHHVLIVGSGPRALRLSDDLTAIANGRQELVGFVDTNDNIAHQTIEERMLGTLEELERVLMHSVVDEVLIALPIKSRYEQIQEVIHTCERMGVQSTYLADIFQPSIGRVHYQGGACSRLMISKVVHDDDDGRMVAKRVVDLVGATVGLLLLWPVLLAIAIAIKLTSGGPAIFAQERYGFHKRRFRIYKFRTMVADAEDLQVELEARNEADGPVFKIAEDPRVTPVGKLLRRTSLDELPQLWNVLMGDMSLVGPRPLPLRDVGRFDEGSLMRRFSMRPGLTCLWQISGRSTLGFAEWVQLDLLYIDQWSFVLDLKILVKTIPAVFQGTGAS